MALNLTAARTLLNPNPDPYQPLRRKVQTGLEDLSAAPTYDPTQALGRSFRSGLEQQAATSAMGLAYDPEQVKAVQLGEIERQAQQGREQLGRVFALDPGGLRSGGGQRQFEQYEGSVLGTKATALTDIYNRTGQEQRANIGVQQGILAQTGAEDRAGQAQRIAGLQAGQAFLGQEDQRSLAQNEQALAAQQQEFGQGITGRQMTLQEVEQQQANRAREAGMTGRYGAGALTAAHLGVDVTGVRAGAGYTARGFEALQELADALNAQGLLEGKTQAEAEQIARTLLDGGTVDFGKTQTLAAQQQVWAQGIGGRQQTEAEAMGGAQRTQMAGTLAEQTRAAQAQESLAGGALTGTYDGKQTVEALNSAVLRAIQQGQMTGVYTDPQTKTNIQTLQAQLQQEQIKAQRAEQTGTYGGGVITAADLGVDVSNFNALPSGVREERFFAIENALRQRGFLEGKSYEELSQMVMTLLGGQAVRAGGVQTLAAGQQAFTQGLASQQQLLAGVEQFQANQARAAGLTGTYGGGQLRATDLGVDVSRMDPQDARVVLMTALEQMGLTQGKTPQQIGEMVNALAAGQAMPLPAAGTLQAQRQTADIETQRAQTELQRIQLAQQNQQFLTQVTGKVNAGLPVGAADFGIDTTGAYDANDKITPKGQALWFQLVDALSVAGIQLDARQIVSVLHGLPVQAAMGTTLEARAQGAGVAQQQASLAEQTRAAQAQESLQGGALTGTYQDQKTIAAQQLTQQGSLEQQRIDLQEEAQDNDKRITEAQLMGQLDLLPTLQARQQQIDWNLRQIDQQMSQQQFLTTQTGQIAGGQQVSAAMLGVDVSGAIVNGQLTPKGQQAKTALQQALSAAGLNPGNADYLLQGGSLTSPTTRTLSALQQGIQAGQAQQQFGLQQEQVTGQLGVQQGQLTLAQQQEQARQQEARAGMTGQLPVTARDLGINLDNYRDARGQLLGTAQDRLRSAFTQRFGRGPNAYEMSALSEGQGVLVRGQAGLQNVTLGGRQATVAEAEQAATAAYQTGQLGVAQGQLSLSDRQQLAQERQAEAAITGQWQTSLTAAQFGIDARALAEGAKTGNLDYYWSLVDRWPAIEAEFTEVMGRGMTMDEQSALMRGQDIKGTYKATLEDRKLALEASIARAEQSGLYRDPDTGRDLDTLEKDLQEFNVQRARQQDSFDNQMTLAQQSGYLTLGGNGSLSAADLGVDTQYVAQLSNEDALASPEAQRLQAAYRAMTNGQTLNNQQMVSLLRNGTTAISQPIKVETMQARAQREQTGLQWSELSGKLGAAKTEAARQFDASLADREDLTEAQVAQINAGIRQADDQMEQQLIQFAADKQIAWAELLGQGYGAGNISAQSLGITDLPNMQRATPEQRAQAQQAVTQAFTAMTGRAPDARELDNLVGGGSVAVQNSPTLAARTLATQVSTQALERQADLHKFSQQYDLDERKFTEATDEADRQYNLTAQQVSQQYGLDQQKFLMAKMEVEAGLTGRIGISGSLSPGDLGVIIDKPVREMSTAEAEQYRTALRESFTALQNRPPSPDELNALLNRGTVQVQALSTLERQQWAANQAEVARRYGFDQQQFAEASDQFDKQFKMNERNSWLQINGRANVDATGQLQFRGDNTTWTQDYLKYYDAKTAFAKTEGQRDLLWTNMLRQGGTTVQAPAATVKAVLGFADASGVQLQRALQDGSLAAAFKQRYGFDITADQATALLQNRTLSVTVPAWDDETITNMSNFINQHSMAVADASQGTGFGQVAGSIIGGTVGMIFGGVGAGVGAAVGRQIGGAYAS